jgi:hypothetical protein
MLLFQDMENSAHTKAKVIEKAMWVFAQSDG